MPPSSRLADATLPSARAGCRRPTYDRRPAPAGVVHLGLGAFSRAHVVAYLDELLAAGEAAWSVCGVSLRSPAVRDALAPQDGLYSLLERPAAGTGVRVVGAVVQVLVAPEDPAAVVAALAAPSTRLVTVTATEKAYCRSPADGSLLLDAPEVVHDLASPQRPRGLLGYLVAGLAERRRLGTGGVAVASCDNLPANGRSLRRLVLALAARRDDDLAAWIEASVRFPSSMVDRIVPATDDRLRREAASALGLVDAWPVGTEPFSQWVLEDDLGEGAPPLGEVGVQLVADVAPWERLKLRVLNGLHSAAAYWGLAAGCTTVDEVVGRAAGRAFLEAVAAEVVPVAAGPAGVDGAAYATTALGRFANPALGHRCAQIAMDGTQKLPQRVLDAVRARLSAGLGADALAEVVALWAWSTLGRDGAGGVRPVEDPLADRLAALAARWGDDPGALVEELLGLDAVFGDLGRDGRFRTAVATAAGEVWSRARA